MRTTLLVLGSLVLLGGLLVGSSYLGLYRIQVSGSDGGPFDREGPGPKFELCIGNNSTYKDYCVPINRTFSDFLVSLRVKEDWTGVRVNF